MYALPPTLQLVTRAPLVVRGERFAPGARVRVVEVAPTRRVVFARVDMRGSFVAKLLAGDRCSMTVVVARPPTGAQVTLEAPPPPLCPPASTP